MTPEFQDPEAKEQTPTLSDIKRKATEFIVKKGGLIEFLYDAATAADISREIYALDETKRFAVETGLFTQVEIDQIKSPPGRKLTYEPVDLARCDKISKS